MDSSTPSNSFLLFSKTMEKISVISGRLEIQDKLTEYFRSVISDNKQDLINVIYLCTCTVYPEYKNQRLNLGDKIIYDVLTECTSKKLANLKKEYRKEGDFGTIAMKYRASQLFISKRTLSVKDVVNGLRNISEISGTNSKTLKIRKMLEMVAICSPIETKYLFRLFEERLNVKVAFKTVLIALSKVYDDSCENKIKEAYHRRPDLEQLVSIILEKGVKDLDTDFIIEPGIPLKPMLAQPSKNISTAFKRVENKKFTCENKYDGERIQIHRFNDKTVIYSRNLENTSSKYGDIAIKSNNDKDFVIDGEVVAYDVVNKKILPFQVFLIDRSLEERRKVLYEEFEKIDNKFYFSEHIDCENIEEIEDFFIKSKVENYEGIMIKVLGDGSKYMPSQRSNSWIKLKKDYIDSGSDSFDLVVIGAYFGKGKRTGWYGGFLLASYNDNDEVYETVCKIGTGFDENTLSRLYEELNNFVVEFPKNVRFKDQTKPDVWISPKYVWEVKAAAVSVSPIYCCGMQHESKGFSLRFPRFLRERDDKTNTDATTSSQIILNYNEANDIEIEDDVY
ncbi:hypothetical protein P3W45_001564 [Vairimorpha bombi]